MATLQNRQKWTTIKRNFEVGDIVLLKSNEFVVRNQWAMAKVIGTNCDENGLVRSVKLLVAGSNSIMERPISKIILLLENEL